MQWRRAGELALVPVLLVLAFAYLGNPTRTLVTLRAADLASVADALAATLASIVVWSVALFVLLRVQGYRLHPARFLAAFASGMGLRGVVPGGSTTGPAVLGFLVARGTGVPGETATAMAYVTEILLWTGSAVVAAAGFGLLVAAGNPDPVVLKLAAVVATGGLAVAAVVAYGVTHPTPAINAVRRLAAALHGFLRDYSLRAANLVHPATVEDRLDDFLGALRRLARDPVVLSPALAAAVLGWFVRATTLVFVLKALDAPAPVAVALFVVPIAGLTRGLSVLPGGVGSVETGVAALLIVLTPLDLTAATTVAVLYRLATYWFLVGLGALCLPALGIDDAARRRLATPLDA